MSHKTWVQPFPIRIHDVDAAGIVFFANYFILAHDVYESFLAHVGHSISAAIEEKAVLVPVVESHCRYRRPMRHGETITGRLTIAQLKHSSFSVRTEFVGADGVTRAELTVRHVCVNPVTMKPVPLPPDMHRALEEYRAPEPAE